MKKWLVFLLLLLTAAGTFIPCCQDDDCCADQIATTTNQENNNEEGTCSPFFSCVTCPGFVELARPIQLVLPISEKQVHHEKIVRFNLSTYSATCWQPPRYC